MYWLGIIILAYLFFSLSFFGDKLILSGPPNPKLYTFYVGALNVLVIFLLPFTPFGSYTLAGLAWAMLTAIVSILGLYTMFRALEKFEVSRVMSTIGALQPILVLVFTGMFWGFGALTHMNFAAFTMLLAGSIAISIENKVAITLQYLILTMFSSGMFSLAYVFSKLVFLNQDFLPGLVLISLSTFLLALTLLTDGRLRSQIFAKKPLMNRNTKILFLFSQMAGGSANVLQSLAIYLAPVSSLAVINALRGVQYVFLFIITLCFSLFFPHILQEDLSKKIVIQKSLSILFIVLGLAILVIY